MNKHFYKKSTKNQKFQKLYPLKLTKTHAKTVPISEIMQLCITSKQKKTGQFQLQYQGSYTNRF
jgi:hypothetical protein